MTLKDRMIIIFGLVLIFTAFMITAREEATLKARIQQLENKCR